VNISISGINGAALATALSVFFFNLIRLILIQIKMKMHPFSQKTIHTILVLFVLYFVINLLPISGYVIFDIFWRTILVFTLFIPILFRFNLSEDIKNIAKDILKRINN
jgi:cytochrome b561